MRRNRFGKRIVAFLMTAVLAGALMTGCGSSGGSASSGGGGKILCIFTDTNDTFRATLASSLQSAAKSEGASMDYVESGSDASAQVELISSAKSKGYSAIILRAVDASTALQLNIASNDLPIIYINNEPSEGNLEKDKFIYVGSDEKQAGQYQAEYVLKKLGNPKSLNVIIFQGENGHSATIARTQAAKRTLRQNGCNATYVFNDTANWSDKEAEEKFDIFMKTGQSVDAVICNNDSMALGAIEAMKKHGLDYTKIPVCGVDATADACASIEAGEMQFTALQDAKNMAIAAVKAATILGGGGSTSEIDGATENGKYIYVPFVPVDKSNVSQYK